MRSFHLRRSLGVAVFLSLSVGIGTITDLSAERWAIPAAEAQEKSRRLVQAVYGDELAAAKSRTEKATLARKLLDDAKKQDSISDRFSMLQAAKNLAITAGDIATILEITSAIAASYEVQNATEASTALLAIDHGSLEKSTKNKLAESLLSLVGALVMNEDFGMSEKAASSALLLASSARDPQLTQSAQSLVKLERQCRSLHSEAVAAEMKLMRDKQDVAAITAVGKYRCFVRRDWSNGLPYLEKTVDDNLRALATRDIGSALMPELQLGTADAWWEFAETADGVISISARQRAHHWYRSALSTLKGLDQLRVEKRMAELARSSAFPSSDVSQMPSAPGRSTPALRESLTFDVQFFEWKSGQLPVKMIHKNDGFCYLSGVKGAFDGMGEWAVVNIGDDGFWYVAGNTLNKQGMVLTAVAVRIRIRGH